MNENAEAPRGPMVTTRVALLSIVGFWLFYFAIITIRSAVLGFEGQVEMLGRRAIVSLVSMGITWFVWLVLRRLAAKPLTTLIIVAGLLAVPASILYSTVNYYAFLSHDEKFAAKQRAEREKAEKRVVIDGKGGVFVQNNGKTIRITPPPGVPMPQMPPIPPIPPIPSAPQGSSVMVQVGGSAPSQDYEEKTPLAAIGDQAANGYFFFAAWAALYLAFFYAAQVREAERRTAGFRAAARDAELRALRYQVNPHFLFNTLNALSSLVMKDHREEAERMIMNLSTFFRTSLTADPTEDVMLSEEIHLQRLYLDIEAVRFPDRLSIDIQVPPALLTACVPGLILQPLVENAIKHGVSRSRRPVTIRIRAMEDSEGLVLSVEDDGDPLPGGAAADGTGLGLRNVRNRLAARFGDDARVRWGPTPGGGFMVSLFMPLVRRDC